MLTNNKKSYFVKGIAMLMAMLMVLSVCLTGCGKKAEEAIQKAEAAQGSADEAKTAADAVKAMLADYLKAADGATKAEIEALIDAALADFETAKELSSFVKSDKFDELKTKVDSLLTADAVNAAINALKDSKADKSELTAIDNALQALIAAKADIATTATKAEVEALEDALTKMIDAEQTAINGILSTLEGKASNDALAAAKTELTNLINGKATAADITEALKSYVKADEYATLKAAVEKNAADMDEALKILSADVRDLVEGMPSVKDDVNALKEKVTALEDSMTEVWKSISEISANLPGLQTALNALTTQVAGLDAGLIQLQADVTTISQGAKELQIDVSELAARVEALEAVDLDATITDALAGYAASQAKVESVIIEILKDFYGTEQKTEGEETYEVLVDRNGNEIKVDFKTMTAEQIFGLLMLNPIWSETEWNETTEEVIQRIADLKELLNTIYGDDAVYLLSEKEDINELFAEFGITIFKDGVADNREHVEELMLYTLLRTPNGTKLAKFNEALDEANGIKVFKDKWKELYISIDAIGHQGHVGDDVYFFVTYEDDQMKAFSDFGKKMDAFVAQYISEKAFDHVISNTNTSDYYEMYLNLKTLPVMYYDADGYMSNTATGNTATLWTTDADLNKVRVTIASLRDEAIGTKTITKLPENIYDMYWTTNMDNTRVDGVELDDYAKGYEVFVALDNEDKAAIYNAYYNQFKNHYNKIVAANTAFDDFLLKVIIAEGFDADNNDLKGKYGDKYNTIASLKDLTGTGLVEGTVENDFYDALIIEMALASWDKKDEYASHLEDDVKVLMDEVEAFNKCCDAHYEENHDLLPKYELYYNMYQKLWMVKFNEYLNSASVLLETIYDDYVSVSLNALANAEATDKLLVNADCVVTENFLAGFFAGDKTFTGWKHTDLVVEKSFTKDSSLAYFYLAKNIADTGYVADPVVTLADYILAYQTATGSKENIIRADLMNAQLAAAKMLYGDKSVEDKESAEYKGLAGITEKVEGVDNPATLFTSMFERLLKDLDEVYYRYLMQDFKAAQINQIYNLTDDIANRYSIYDATTDTVLITAMQDYLISTNEGNVAPYGIDALKNGTLVANLKDYAVPGIGKLNAMPDYTVAYAPDYAEIMQHVADAKIVLWEMAVMDNFEAYYLHAVEYLDAARLAYSSIEDLDSSRSFRLNQTYTQYAEKISDQKREDYIKGYDFGTTGDDNEETQSFLEAYFALLGVVATKELDEHLADIYKYVNGTVNSFEAELNEIDSYDEVLADYPAEGMKRLYKPTNYDYVGAAVDAFDRDVNIFAVNNDGEKLYNY